MNEYMPLIAVGAVIGTVSAVLIMAYAMVKDKKESMGFDRNMSDLEIFRRLMKYAKPYRAQFLLVGLLVLFSIIYDIMSPKIIGDIEELVVGDFELKRLYISVGVKSMPFGISVYDG